VLEAGRVAEVGNHEESMGLGRVSAGLYAVRRQILGG